MLLLVDDERRDMTSYLEELRLSGHKIEFRKDVGVAFNFLKDHLQEIELLILDIMMPPGALLANVATNGGLRTGVRFYESVRQLSPELPILILTNVSDAQVAEHFQDEPRCWFLRKEDCLPFELADEVKRILSELASRNS